MDPGPYPYIQVVLNVSPVGVFSVAYLDSYNPGSGLGVNYIGDAGFSGPGWYQVYVPLGHDLILVMHEVNVNGGLNQPYSLLVEGFYDTQYNDTSGVPEPGTGLMAAGALALAALAAARRRIREGRRVLVAAVVVLAISPCAASVRSASTHRGGFQAKYRCWSAFQMWRLVSRVRCRKIRPAREAA